MAKPSIYIPDEVLDDFDERITEMRRSGEVDINTSRSEVIQELINQWLEGNSTLTSTGSERAATTAD